MQEFGLRLKLLVVTVACVLNFAAAAREGGETVAWNSIKTGETVDQLEAFLAAYPIGQFAREARQKYSRIANTMLAAQVQKIKVDFPKAVRSSGRSVGPIRVAKLNILVQEDGKAGDVHIAQSSGFHPYDEAALSAARSATYLPAMDHGMPVVSRMDYDVSFCLLCNQAAPLATTRDIRRPQGALASRSTRPIGP